MDIFNRILARKRLQRAAAAGIVPRFLWDKVAQQLQDRLLDVRRDFATAVEIGPYPAVLTPEFLTQKKIDKALFAGALTSDDAQHVLIDEEFFPFADASCDAIISLGHLHNTNDLPGVLLQMRRALKPDGLFMGALCGGETLAELRSSIAAIEQEFLNGMSPRVSPFAGLQDMAALMQRAGFALPVVDQERVTVTYKDILSLIADLRAMGQTNLIARQNKRILPKNFWPLVEDHYRQHFGMADGRLEVTVDILYLIGWCPDASQQQPARRGSATHRLADMLQSEEIGTGDFIQ